VISSVKLLYILEKEQDRIKSTQQPHTGHWGNAESQWQQRKR